MRNLIALLLPLAVSASLALADPVVKTEEATTGVMKKKNSKSNSRKSKGRRAGEKEAEGTEAPDRFEADTVIKSQYRLHGESLEVDPD